MAVKSTVWIIGECSSDGDEVRLIKVEGTKDKVKGIIASRVRQLKDEDPEGFDYGSTAKKDVSDYGETLSGYAIFSDSHVQISAEKLESIRSVP